MKAPATAAPATPQPAEREAAPAPQADRRPAAVAQRQLQTALDASPRQAAQRQQAAATQPRPNRTGLPDQLKAGVENLSGYSLDDVKVHYNSAKPAQLQAHAYAQGTDIHVAPGQEKHLPHEAWHVVQQKQGRVRATRQLKGEVAVNDDAELEQEADVMGRKAQAVVPNVARPPVPSNLAAGSAVAQTAREMSSSSSSYCAASPVQLAIMRFRPRNGTPAPLTLEKMANRIDNLTTLAHIEVLKALQAGTPSLIKNLVSDGGYYTNWLKHPNAMTTGYVIEDIITKVLKGQPGYETQVVHGGARPDFVIEDKATKGVVDITSSGEAGHVLDKNFNLSSYDYVAESLYPSIDFSDIKGSSFTFTQQDLELVQASNKTRAKAKLGEKLSVLRKTLRLIADQGMNEKKASSSAIQAIKAINKFIQNPASEELALRADSLIEDVVINYSQKIFLEDVSGIKEDIMKKYDVDESVFAKLVSIG